MPWKGERMVVLIRYHTREPGFKGQSRSEPDPGHGSRKAPTGLEVPGRSGAVPQEPNGEV